jgi:DNA-binding CsgD family transcriptional regulator
MTTTVLGRDREIGVIRDLAGSISERGGDHLLIMLGDAGIGKSALLADFTAHASARGLLVLCATGRERESASPFAGLRHLLRPVLVELLAQPGPEAEELRAALAMAGPHAAPAPDLAATALLDLLARNAGPGAALVVDDAQWIDPASLEVLAFAAHRLDAGPVTMILAARGDVPPPGFEQGVPELRLGPLTAASAGDLLDVQPYRPCGRARAQVLAQAAGNPLALIELTRALADDPAAEHNGAGLPLPLTGRLSGVFAARLGALPAATRQALLLAAAADSTERDMVTRAEPAFDPAVLAPAEELGLIAVDAAGARFRHPLIRSAVYHDAPFASRAAVHRRLAELLHDQPDRRAWHLAAATLRPDEGISSLLAATAIQAERRSGPAAAALALERAGDLSPDPAARARHLLAAAEAAVSTGQTQWARDLAAHALPLTGDPLLRSRCRHVTGWALTWGGRYADAARVLLSLARETARDDPGGAWNALGLAATAAYEAGAPDVIQAVAHTLTVLPPATAAQAQASCAWALAVTGGRHEAAILLRQLRATSSGDVALHHAGAAAWLLDQTPDAIRLLDAARNKFADAGQRAASGGVLAPLGWACLDAGRWDDALALAAETDGEQGTDIAPGTRILITAAIEAARGNTGHARELIAAALAADPGPARLITARARHALGLCALAEGEYPTAFGQLHQLFESDGTPYHPHVSYLAAGDLALAASRAGRRLDGRAIVKQIATALPRPSPRLCQLLARADGILADPSASSAYPDDVLSDPRGERWPFERAQLRLEYGEWLRRRRQINQAKPVLGAALDAFRALKSLPWAHRAETELRACGIAVAGCAADAGGLRALTPQQRQIVALAAEGLSNQQIAERLFLSHRTVESHLYRSFPKLGVARRNQLQTLLARADRAVPAR